MYENEGNDEIEIDLRELFYVLKRKLWIVILTTIIFAGIAGIVTEFFITPIYSSTAQLYILSKDSTISELTDLQLGTELTQDYMV